MLQAGTATVDVTPPLGTLMAGNAGLRRTAEGVLDRLAAKALVLRAGGTTVALVSCDVIGVEAASTARIRGQIGDATDVPPEAVMVTATHTHTGPATIRSFREPDEAYLAHFEKQVASAVRLARADMAPATVSAARGEEPTLSFNRRVITADGEVVLPTQAFDPADVEGAEGPTDPTLDALTVEDDAGDVRAVVVTYTTHTDVVTGYEISADFPGTLEDALQGVYGEDTAVLYLPGAAGNVSSYDPSKEYPTREHYLDPEGARRARAVGRVLAGSTLRAVEPRRSAATADPQLAVDATTVALETRAPAPERLADARAIEDDGDATLRERVLARSVRTFAEYQAETPTVDVEVQAVRVGGTVLVGLPGEPFVEFGLRIKEAVPGRVSVAGYTNDKVGYFPTERAFENGGYETTAGWVSRFVPDAGDRLADAAIDLARGLRS